MGREFGVKHGARAVSYQPREGVCGVICVLEELAEQFYLLKSFFVSVLIDIVELQLSIIS